MAVFEDNRHWTTALFCTPCQGCCKADKGNLAKRPSFVVTGRDRPIEHGRRGVAMHSKSAADEFLAAIGVVESPKAQFNVAIPVKPTLTDAEKRGAILKQSGLADNSVGFNSSHGSQSVAKEGSVWQMSSSALSHYIQQYEAPTTWSVDDSFDKGTVEYIEEFTRRKLCPKFSPAATLLQDRMMRESSKQEGHASLRLVNKKLGLKDAAGCEGDLVRAVKSFG